MRRLIVGGCRAEGKFDLADPDGASEIELEAIVVRALTCLYPAYQCFVFGGSFAYEGRRYRPDLAMVARDRTHWFVLEVELTSHSLEHHVLPQIRAFQFGEPQADCVASFIRERIMATANAKTFLRFVPRNVAVIANKRSRDWEVAVNAIGAQLLTVSIFRSTTGEEAVEVDGLLEMCDSHLGFGVVRTTDRALVFGNPLDLSPGDVQVHDPGGAIASWEVLREDGSTWLVKKRGTPDFADNSYVQLIRTRDGRLSFRRPRTNRSTERGLLS